MIDFLRNIKQNLRGFRYTWVDLTAIRIFRKHTDLAGKFRCFVELSDGSNIELVYRNTKTNAEILIRANKIIDDMNAENSLIKISELLDDIRLIAKDKIDEINNPNPVD